MDQKRRVRTSKYLSRHLRHDPGRIGLTLGRAGWVAVDELLDALAAHSFALTMDELIEVVEKNDKRRFSFDQSRTHIRANQGHSVEVDLELVPAAPPDVLFHGTGRGSLDSIVRMGIERRNRHHVHLSPDRDTAMRVGSRHGRPVVLEVASGRMAADGHRFHLTANGVWLTLAVPPEYLTATGGATSSA